MFTAAELPRRTWQSTEHASVRSSRTLEAFSFSSRNSNHRKNIMITLECNYSKKIGLPGYSSHQFSVTLKSELLDLNKVSAETDRLYGLLQNAVDSSIQQIGYLPGGNGAAASVSGEGHATTHGSSNGRSATLTNGNGNGNGHSDSWHCSDKQKALVVQIIDENQIPKAEVEALARERFNTPVKLLNKLQTSGLITELLNRYPPHQYGSRTPVPGAAR
jgi:hypothetical protein